MTRTQIKQNAQDELMHSIQSGFTRISESVPYSYCQSDAEAINTEMSRQMARAEKLFGFEPFSWHRGV